MISKKSIRPHLEKSSPAMAGPAELSESIPILYLKVVHYKFSLAMRRSGKGSVDTLVC